jgi:hypothetical protein
VVGGRPLGVGGSVAGRPPALVTTTSRIALVDAVGPGPGPESAVGRECEWAIGRACEVRTTCQSRPMSQGDPRAHGQSVFRNRHQGSSAVFCQVERGQPRRFAPRRQRRHREPSSPPSRRRAGASGARVGGAATLRKAQGDNIVMRTGFTSDPSSRRAAGGLGGLALASATIPARSAIRVSQPRRAGLAPTRGVSPSR